MSPSSSAQGHRLYRSRSNRVLMGVCGGIAEHFDFNVTAIRILAVLMFFMTNILALIAYIVLGLAMKEEPTRSFASPEEEDFYYTIKASPSVALQRIQRRFDQLDQRLQRMESIVTSSTFETEQAFRDL